MTRTQANPIEADAEGNFPLCHLMEGSFRVEDQDPKGNPLSSRGVTVRDNVIHLGERVSFATLDEMQSDDLLSYDRLPSRHQVQVGDHVRVAQTGFTYVVAPEAAGDAHVMTNGGVGFYEAAGNYSSVARLQAAVARGEPFAPGMTVLADGAIYRFVDDGNTELPGLPGWALANDAALSARVDAAELLAETADSKADLALAATGSNVYADEASGLAATQLDEVFLIARDTGLEARRNDGATSTRIGWVSEVLFDDLSELMTTSGGFEAGTVLRTRKDGLAYEVAASGATDAHHVIPGGTRLYEAGPYTTSKRLARTAGRPGEVRRVVGDLAGGDFVYKAGNYSAKVEKDPMGGVYVPPATDPAGVSGCWCRLHDGTIRAEWFGATGGADDTDAVQACDEFLREMNEARAWELCDVYTTLGFGDQNYKTTYPTKADAVAALSGLLEYDVIRVAVDESRGGSTFTQYRVKNGALVHVTDKSLNGKSIFGRGAAKNNGFKLKAGAPAWMKLMGMNVSDGVFSRIIFNGNNPSSQWGGSQNNPDTELLVYVEGYGVSWEDCMVRHSGGNGVKFAGIVGSFEWRGGDCVAQYNNGWGVIIGQMSSFRATRMWVEGNDGGDILLKNDMMSTDGNINTAKTYWKASSVVLESIYSENSADVPIIQIEGGHFAPRIGAIARPGHTDRIIVHLKNSSEADSLYRGCQGGYFNLGGLMNGRIVIEDQARGNTFVRQSIMWTAEEGGLLSWEDAGRDNVCRWETPDDGAYVPGAAPGNTSINTGSTNMLHAVGSGSGSLTAVRGGLIGAVQDYHSSFVAGPGYALASNMDTNAAGTEITVYGRCDISISDNGQYYLIVALRAEAYQRVTLTLVDFSNGNQIYDWDTDSWVSTAGLSVWGRYKILRADRFNTTYRIPFKGDGVARTSIRPQFRIAGSGSAELYHVGGTDVANPALFAVRSGQFLGTPGNAVASSSTLAPANVVPVGTRVFNVTSGENQVSNGTGWIAG